MLDDAVTVTGTAEGAESSMVNVAVAVPPAGGSFTASSEM